MYVCIFKIRDMYILDMYILDICILDICILEGIELILLVGFLNNLWGVLTLLLYICINHIWYIIYRIFEILIDVKSEQPKILVTSTIHKYPDSK